MVLKILNSDIEVREVPSNLKNFLDTFIKASGFASMPVKILEEGLVYVGQSEVALLSPSNALDFLGSEDATTCHIVVMKNPESGLTSLAHLDQVSPKGLDRVVEKLNSPKWIEIHVFGGYEDEKDISEELSLALLQYLVTSNTIFTLGECVIGHRNTTFQPDDTSSKRYPRPILYGVGVDVKTGSLFPAEFPDKSPDSELRHVRLSFRQFESYEEYYEVRDFLYQDFDHVTGEFKIHPFRFARSPDLAFIAKASDKFLLETRSTSPRVEPKHFCKGIRQAANFVLDHPDPMKTIFLNGQPRTFFYSENQKKWIRKMN